MLSPTPHSSSPPANPWPVERQSLIDFQRLNFLETTRGRVLRNVNESSKTERKLLNWDESIFQTARISPVDGATENHRGEAGESNLNDVREIRSRA